MVLCEDLVEVTGGGGGEVLMGFMGYCEAWRDWNGFWVGPLEDCWLWPHIHWEVKACDLRSQRKRSKS